MRVVYLSTYLSTVDQTSPTLSGSANYAPFAANVIVAASQTAVTVLVQLKDSLVSGETDALQASVTGPSGFTYITSGSCASLSAASPGCQVSYATASLTATATFVFTLTVCAYYLPISYALIGN